DRANGFYYIKSGEISIFKMDQQGKEVQIDHLEQGNYLGEAILFGSDTFPVYAKVTKDTELLFFPKERVLNEINKNPKVALHFLTLLSKKCITLNRRIEILSMKTVRQRLIQYLITRCGGDGNCSLELKIKKSELAKLLGTINETLSRNLKQLQDEGSIIVEGRKIHIKNCLALKNEIENF
ncbi:MAG: Crp/Fnr family transcriptional regulator, partial [Spirochaetes bacterium]|nr:Crp/Fnr family transcriptional regulator [Spirochaetota bacterium]